MHTNDFFIAGRQKRLQKFVHYFSDFLLTNMSTSCIMEEESEVTNMDSEMLRKKIDSSMIPKSCIAGCLGITRETLYRKLRGEREFKTSEIKRLATLLHLSNEERDSIFFADYVDKMPTQ